METQPKPKESNLVSWIIILLFVLLIFLKGAFAFFMVGNPGQPSWDYRPIMDVPGESTYAIYKLLPHPQHIRGAGGE